METVSNKVVINSEKENVWALLKELEQVVDRLEEVDSLKKLPDGLLSWGVKVDGAPINWLEELVGDENGGRLSFKMVSGDFEELSGEWLIRMLEGKSELSYRADYRLGLGLLDKITGRQIKERLDRHNLKLLKSIKNLLESNELMKKELSNE